MLGTDKIVELGYQWAVKLSIISVLLALWEVFVSPFTDQLQILMLWWLNQTFFTIISYVAVEFMVQVFIYMITFGMLMWIFDSNGDPSDSTSKWMYK